MLQRKTTAAKAIKRSKNQTQSILKPSLLFFLMAGKKLSALNNHLSRFSPYMYRLVMSRSRCGYFHHDLKPKNCTLTKFSAKFSTSSKARICLMYFSSSFNLLFQSFKSCEGQFLRQSKTSLHFLIPFPNIMMFD
jgi:hypothetical protein